MKANDAPTEAKPVLSPRATANIRRNYADAWEKRMLSIYGPDHGFGDRIHEAKKLFY